MIQKLYNLKKTQTEQKLIEKSSLEQEVYKIDEEVGDLNHRINTDTKIIFGTKDSAASFTCVTAENIDITSPITILTKSAGIPTSKIILTVF